MASSLGNITFDCANPRELSHFWADVFGYPHAEWPDDLKAELLAGGLTEDDLESRGLAEDPEGKGPRLFFQRVPEGKTAKNRMHIDVNCAPGRRSTKEERDAEAQRLVALGATIMVNFSANWGPILDEHYVMQDPEGNEFCIQ
ncbi:MAG: hypothetical protein JWR53_1563 [Glaciihabitans sp.]|jgi:hypothetical protein|nr:hypothetical protein [Glaciihabitans sp.]